MDRLAEFIRPHIFHECTPECEILSPTHTSRKKPPSRGPNDNAMSQPTAYCATQASLLLALLLTRTAIYVDVQRLVQAILSLSSTLFKPNGFEVTAQSSHHPAQGLLLLLTSQCISSTAVLVSTDVNFQALRMLLQLLVHCVGLLVLVLGKGLGREMAAIALLGKLPPPVPHSFESPLVYRLTPSAKNPSQIFITSLASSTPKQRLELVELWWR